MYRGTILELLVGDHVDLRLASGELKRFAMSDVAYAGPSTDAAPAPAPPTPPPPPPPPPPAPQPLVTLDAPPAKLHLEATGPDVDFHIRTGEGTVTGFAYLGRYFGGYNAVAQDYEHICTAPCDATLPAGTHRLALSQGGHSPVEPSEPVTVTGPATVRGTYDSRQGVRIGGWILLGTSLAGMTGLMLASLQTTQVCPSSVCVTESSINGPLMGAGVAVGVVGSLVSAILILQRDTATIEVVPLAGSALTVPAARAEAQWLAPSIVGAQGAGLRVRF